MMNPRSRGREIALQILYLLEQNPQTTPEDVDIFLKRRLQDPKIRAFAQSLIDGVREHKSRIDELISGLAENWSLERMAAIDRNILRVGAFEMLYSEDVPSKVAINEALELAKRYSTAQSSRFVNGILDRLPAAAAAALAAAQAAASPPPGDVEAPTETETETETESKKVETEVEVESEVKSDTESPQGAGTPE